MHCKANRSITSQQFERIDFSFESLPVRIVDCEYQRLQTTTIQGRLKITACKFCFSNACHEALLKGLINHKANRVWKIYWVKIITMTWIVQARKDNKVYSCKKDNKSDLRTEKKLLSGKEREIKNRSQTTKEWRNWVKKRDSWQVPKYKSFSIHCTQIRPTRKLSISFRDH